MPEGRSGRRHTLKITSGPNRGRTVHLGGGKRTYGALRKTSKRGAYAKNKKVAFQTRRAPFVETKSRTHAEMAENSATDPNIQIGNPLTYDVLLNDDAFTHFRLLSFNSMTQGLGEMQMVGASVYSRFLKLKCSFLYPNGDNQLDVPTNQYLVHGWIKAPMNLTDLTTPVVYNTNRQDIQNYIAQRVQPYFNDREDKLRFIPKSNTGIKILGYRKIKNNKNASFSTEGSSVGPINMSCTWRINRKIAYEQGYPNPAIVTGLGPNDDHRFPNNSWLPFALIYNPQFASLPQGSSPDPKSVIRVAYNDCHWFSDS